MKLTIPSYLLVLTLGGATGQATWKPGDFSDGSVVEDTERGTKIFLSNGLKGKAIAYSGEPVMSADGSTQLADEYHANCDGGATFDKSDGSGGYYYVSNSEFGEYPDNLVGGVYSLEMDADHNLVAYQRVLENTAKNCHGGVTPWNTWISCEETRADGRCWQVDPAGVIPAKVTNVTGIHGLADFGNWEAFAWDDDSQPPQGYTTNDDFPDEEFPVSYRGAIVRFTPDDTALACRDQDLDEAKWCTVDSGTHDFLKLIPASDGASTGTFEWVSTLEEANPSLYAGSEGAHVENSILTFCTILERYLFRLNLVDGTYVRSAVPFSQEPDNLRMLGDTVYVCTDGDLEPGDAVWGWDSVGAFRVFYEEGHNYAAGVDFTPDKKIMYVSMYGEATWQFWRDDGMAFDEDTAGIVYEVMGGIDEGKNHADIQVLPSNGGVSGNPDVEATSSGTTGETSTGTEGGSAATSTEGGSAAADSSDACIMSFYAKTMAAWLIILALL